MILLSFVLQYKKLRKPYIINDLEMQFDIQVKMAFSTVHRGTAHRGTVHRGTAHRGTVHRGTAHRRQFNSSQGNRKKLPFKRKKSDIVQSMLHKTFSV